MARLWPPPAGELRPVPLDRITADVAACVIASDLPLLWSPRWGAAGGGRFVRPSQSVFLRQGTRPHSAVLQLCGRMGLLIVEPPEHLVQVPPICGLPTNIATLTRSCEP